MTHEWNATGFHIAPCRFQPKQMASQSYLVIHQLSVTAAQIIPETTRITGLQFNIILSWRSNRLMENNAHQGQKGVKNLRL